VSAGKSTRRDFLATAAPLAVAGGAAGNHADKATPGFRLGIVTYNIAATWDLATILRVCKSLGYAAVELRTTHRHGVEPSLSARERTEVRKRFEDAGVTIWGCGTVCEFHASDAALVRKNIETCKQFVQLTHDLGGRGVKVRPNGLPKDVPVPTTLDQIGAALAECGQAAADAGVEIWLEVHGAGTSHPPHCRTIMQRCAHKCVGITWNSNPQDVKDGSVAPYFESLRPWIRSCHINELHSGYPYRELFRLLRNMKYDRFTLAEIPGAADVASAERLLRYYKALWTELAGSSE
jgi:sugar phosphate isomerase/epimerase